MGANEQITDQCAKASPGIELRGVTKIFRGGIVALKDFDLTVEDAELMVLVGPSGSGKSTASVAGHRDGVPR